MWPLNSEQFFFIGLGIIILWLMLITVILWRVLRHYRRLIGKSNKYDLKKILEDILANTNQQKESLVKLEKRCDQNEKKSLKYLQKIGFLRFNPFSDTGGDQSFILSLLDAEENGILLSSLHSRGSTRLYAKAIKKGEGDNISLSKEEKEVINKTKMRRSLL